MQTEKRLIATARVLVAVGVVIVACGGIAADATGATGEQLIRNGDMESDGSWQSTNCGNRRENYASCLSQLLMELLFLTWMGILCR